ncbi:MAG: Phosphotransferase system, phosphocarrier protein HPr [Clostridia bacterium]|jgi:phosphocarrier protein|nr:Phosphotransferase system, phosphocarrier protein HPr [Clostridia bacterium]
MVEIKLIMTNKSGLHARPAAEFTKLAARFKSKITLEGNGKTADAKSLLMILTMGIRQGGELTVKADGPDEIESIEALKNLVEGWLKEG